jgi:ATP-binding cassette subfamily F protein 3
MIILDEPTNHLDIDSRAARAEAINEFPGASSWFHDRYLIEACADQLGGGDHGHAYDGDLDDYRMVVGARACVSVRATADNERRRRATSPVRNKPRSGSR